MSDVNDVIKLVKNLSQRQYAERLKLAETLANTPIPHEGKLFQYDFWVVNSEVICLEKYEAWSTDTFGQAVGVDNVMTRCPFTNYTQVIRGDLLLQVGTLVYRDGNNLVFEKK